MGIFTEAGIFAVVALGAFVAGLIVTLRSVEPERASMAFASLILAFGIIGAGTGQRLVDTYVQKLEPLDQKVAALSVGTREASANHLLGGGMASLLLGLGMVVGRSRRER